MTCPNCNQQLTRSDFYISRGSDTTEAKCGKCRGSFDPYLMYENDLKAQTFDPIVIWVNNEDPNKFSFPARSDEPVDPGYHKVEITNLREADRWTKHINTIETNKVSDQRAMEREYWNERTRERRADIRAKIGSNPRAKALFEAVQKFVDAKRERRYSKPLDAHAHFQVIAFDSSNRQGYSDESTGWKDRRS